MGEILLHIGHGKTGSSYLQSVLAKNVETLRSARIIYPEAGQAVADAAAGKTSAGNRALLLARLQDSPGFFDRPGSLLFSGETLWIKIAERDFAQRLAEVAQAARKPVRLLRFIRDPAEFQLSSYLQAVQQNQERRSLDHFFRSAAIPRQKRLFQQVRRVIETTDQFGFDLTLLNYSRTKVDLLQNLRRFLGLHDAARLDLPETKINRSLSAFELGLARGLGQGFDQLGWQGGNLLKALIDATPGHRALRPEVGTDALAAFCTGVEPAMQRLNSCLPPPQRYQLAPANSDPAEAEAAMDYGTEAGRQMLHLVLGAIVPRLEPGARLGFLRDCAAGASGDPFAIKLWADALRESKHFDQAVPVLRGLLQVAPDPAVHHDLAICLNALGDQMAALDAAKAALTPRPAYEPSLSLYFHTALRCGHHDQAEAALKRAAAEGLRPALVHFLAHKLAMARGDGPLARSELDKALQLAPRNRNFQAAKSLLSNGFFG
jgi:hypothetical protein